MFDSPVAPADLGRALATIPGQLARGFGTICIKPSQFIDDGDEVEAFCADVIRRVSLIDTV